MTEMNNAVNPNRVVLAYPEYAEAVPGTAHYLTARNKFQANPDSYFDMTENWGDINNAGYIGTKFPIANFNRKESIYFSGDLSIATARPQDIVHWLGLAMGKVTNATHQTVGGKAYHRHTLEPKVDRKKNMLTSALTMIYEEPAGIGASFETTKQGLFERFDGIHVPTASLTVNVQGQNRTVSLSASVMGCGRAGIPEVVGSDFKHIDVSGLTGGEATINGAYYAVDPQIPAEFSGMPLDPSRCAVFISHRTNADWQADTGELFAAAQEAAAMRNIELQTALADADIVSAVDISNYVGTLGFEFTNATDQGNGFVAKRRAMGRIWRDDWDFSLSMNFLRGADFGDIIKNFYSNVADDDVYALQIVIPAAELSSSYNTGLLITIPQCYAMTPSRGQGQGTIAWNTQFKPLWLRDSTLPVTLDIITDVPQFLADPNALSDTAKGKFPTAPGTNFPD